MTLEVKSIESHLLQCRIRLHRLDAELESLPDWTESAPLREAIELTTRRLEELRHTRDRKLAVVIVGPCGAGKSTLLNALAGEDGLAESGPARPTTHDLTIFCSQPEDGNYFKEKIGAEYVNVVASAKARELRDIILIDTPDTNSTDGERHRPIVEAAIEAADVLLCLFPVDRATVRDQIVYLKPWIKLFNCEGLYTVVTMSEKLPAEKLESEVIAPLQKLLGEVWPRLPHRLLAVSARSHLNRPEWNQGETPEPAARDEFLALQEVIRGQLNSAAYAADLRSARATEWTNQATQSVVNAAALCAPSAREAAERIHALSARIMKTAAPRVSSNISVSGLEFRIARRLWGPLSWCLMLWAFLLQLVDLIGAVAGAFRRVVFWNRWSDPKAKATESAPSPSSGTVVSAVTSASETSWPDIENLLRHAAFAPSARGNPLRGSAADTYARRVENQLTSERDGLGMRLADETFSGVGPVLILNLLFLAPILTLVGASSLRLWHGEGIWLGFGREGAYFIGMWWILVLSLMHAWVIRKESGLGRNGKMGELLNHFSPTPIAPELTGELETLLALAKQGE